MSETTTTESMIRLEGVGKTYAGTKTPAVEALSLDIRRGEILVLVGPSGCGKSTTLRLINRMIEPTSGRIFLEGEDVTDVNPDKLRRRIGYVIQQIGLFPHRTIAQNIATVPKMLGWQKNEIPARVDELLEMVGMDPGIFRDRYPKELSGGQAQRVGVARALGADPDIMLMDEPFGAIDPITRESLQNEFLRLQEELQKTIVFVTHDIDEATKMGDRIAVLGERSSIRQLDTPERLLANPIDDYVDDFIGSGSTLRGLNFEAVGNLELGRYLTVGPEVGPQQAAGLLRDSNQDWLLVLDREGRPSRWVQEPDLLSGGEGYAVKATVTRDASLYDTLEQMVQSEAGSCCVVDDSGSLSGVVEFEDLTEAIKRAQAEAQEHYELELQDGGA